MYKVPTEGMLENINSEQNEMTPQVIMTKCNAANIKQNNMQNNDIISVSRSFEETDTRNNVQRCLNLRPIICVLGLAGCYSFQQPKRKAIEILLWIYKLTLLISSLLWTARFFALMHDWPALVIYLVTTMICLECTGNWLVSWKSFSTNHGHFKSFIYKVNELLVEMTENNIIVDYSYIAKRQLICLIVIVLLVLLDLSIQIGIAYIFLPNTEDNMHYGMNETLPYTFPLEDTVYTRFVVLLPVLFLELSLVVPPFYITIINTVIIAMFKALIAQMDINLLNNKGNMQSVDMFRKCHLKLSSIICNFDKDLSYFYGNIFFWTLCQAILVLFVLIKFDHQHVVLLMLLYMIGLSILVLLVMAVSAALVHEAAHAPLDTIYNINLETISLTQATQLNLFLSKLTGTQIGFTTFGLLTITKEFILTIAGVFLTYFAVLYSTL